jgi:hypothetical protein
VHVSQTSGPAAVGAVFRLPKMAYGVVLFLLIGVTPIALYGGPSNGSPARISGLTVLYLIPILAGVYIARTSTRVDASGFRVTAIFGSRSIDWADVRGVSIDRRNIYAVLDDGAVRLPCVRQRDLTLIAGLSDGRLPQLPNPVVKTAPARRR